MIHYQLPFRAGTGNGRSHSLACTTPAGIVKPKICVPPVSQNAALGVCTAGRDSRRWIPDTLAPPLAYPPALRAQLARHPAVAGLSALPFLGGSLSSRPSATYPSISRSSSSNRLASERKEASQMILGQPVTQRSRQQQCLIGVGAKRRNGASSWQLPSRCVPAAHTPSRAQA